MKRNNTKEKPLKIINMISKIKNRVQEMQDRLK